MKPWLGPAELEFSHRAEFLEPDRTGVDSDRAQVSGFLGILSSGQVNALPKVSFCPDDLPAFKLYLQRRYLPVLTADSSLIENHCCNMYRVRMHHCSENPVMTIYSDLRAFVN